MDIYNDLNDDLFNVFCCVKEKSFSLAKELKFLPVHGRTPFAFYRDMAAHEPDFYRHIEEEKRVVAESTCFTEEEIRELLTILDGNAKLFDVRRQRLFCSPLTAASVGQEILLALKLWTRRQSWINFPRFQDDWTAFSWNTRMPLS